MLDVAFALLVFGKSMAHVFSYSLTFIYIHSFIRAVLRVLKAINAINSSYFHSVFRIFLFSHSFIHSFICLLSDSFERIRSMITAVFATNHSSTKAVIPCSLDWRGKVIFS